MTMIPYIYLSHVIWDPYFKVTFTSFWVFSFCYHMQKAFCSCEDFLLFRIDVFLQLINILMFLTRLGMKQHMFPVLLGSAILLQPDKYLVVAYIMMCHMLLGVTCLHAAKMPVMAAMFGATTIALRILSIQFGSWIWALGHITSLLYMHQLCSCWSLVSRA